MLVQPQETAIGSSQTGTHAATTDNKNGDPKPNSHGIAGSTGTVPVHNSSCCLSLVVVVVVQEYAIALLFHHCHFFFSQQQQNQGGVPSSSSSPFLSTILLLGPIETCNSNSCRRVAAG
jgi:hypothetical protein